MTRRIYSVICTAALIGVSTVSIESCGRMPDGWSKGEPPRSLSNTNHVPQWVVDGPAGTVYIVDPLKISGKYFKKMPLDIDCFISAVAKLKGKVLVGAVRSRFELDSPGGIYSVDIATGSTKLLVEASLYPGEIDSLYVNSPMGVIAISYVYSKNTTIYYATIIDMANVKLVNRVRLPSSKAMSRWAHVGNGILYGLDQDGTLAIVDTITGNIEYKTTTFNRIARSDIEGVIIARTGNRWSEWIRDPDDGSLTHDSSFGSRDGYDASAFRTRGSKTVLITDFEIPDMSIWCIGDNELVINKLYHINNAIDYP